MADGIDEVTLAPLDELIAILPEIQKAKDRDRLGDALQKQPMQPRKASWIPEQLEDLNTLLDVIGADKEKLARRPGPAS